MGNIRKQDSIKDKIVEFTSKLLEDSDFYEKMSKAHNPYGDGKASERIVEFFVNLQNGKKKENYPQKIPELGNINKNLKVCNYEVILHICKVILRDIRVDLLETDF